jgi:hypothetical protein
VIKKLVELGELRSLGGGHYQSTDIKALAAPQPAEEEPAKPNGKHHARYPTSNIVLIWNAVERRKMTTRAEMIQILVDNDRPKTSVNGITAKLTESGRLKPLGEGKYEVIKPKSAKDSKNG